MQKIVEPKEAYEEVMLQTGVKYTKRINRDGTLYHVVAWGNVEEIKAIQGALDENVFNVEVYNSFRIKGTEIVNIEFDARY